MTTDAAQDHLHFGDLRTSGVSWRVEAGGASRTLRIERIELRDVAAQTPFGILRAEGVELAEVALRMPASAKDAPPLQAFEAISVATLRLKDARIVTTGLRLPGAARRSGEVRLEPLAGLDGSLHADIVDAAWIFDADVTIPISGGHVDFNRATVEHVGPDSSMGLSRMGLYVDAPNGRTYLFLLSATHVPGARFERRAGSLLPGWRGDRGAIDLGPLFEGLFCGVALGTPATGTRDLLARSRLGGEFRLGDGVLGDDRRRVVLAGRDRSRNHLALSSLSSSRGIVLRMPDLAASELRWELSGRIVSTGALSGAVSVQLEMVSEAPQATLSIVELVLHDVRIGRRNARSDPSPDVPGR